MAALQSPIVTGQLTSASKLDDHENTLGTGYTKALTILRRGGIFPLGAMICMVSALVFNKPTKLSSFFSVLNT